VDALTGMVQNMDPGTWQTFADLAQLVGQHIGVMLPLLMQLAHAALPGLIVAGQAAGPIVWALARVIEFLTPIIPILTVAFITLRAAIVGARIAMFVFNLVSKANTFGLIVMAITLVVLAVIYMWNHWKGFRVFIQGLWAWLKTASTDTFQWVSNAIGNMVKFVSGVPGKISGAFRGMWDGLKSGLVAVINWAIDKLNGLIRGVNKIGGLVGINIGEINPLVDNSAARTIGNVRGGAGGAAAVVYGGAAPRRRNKRAQGGSISNWAVVGENGPELARHTPSYTEITPLARRRPSGAGLDGAIQLHIEVPVIMRGKEVTRVVADEKSEWDARRGR